MSLLLEDFPTFISSTTVIIGLVLAAVGIAIVCLSRRITRSFRGNVAISNNDRIYVGFVILGLIITIVGFVLIAIHS